MVAVNKLEPQSSSHDPLSSRAEMMKPTTTSKVMQCDIGAFNGADVCLKGLSLPVIGPKAKLCIMRGTWTSITPCNFLHI